MVHSVPMLATKSKPPSHPYRSSMDPCRPVPAMELEQVHLNQVAQQEVPWSHGINVPLPRGSLWRPTPSAGHSGHCTGADALPRGVGEDWAVNCLEPKPEQEPNRERAVQIMLFCLNQPYKMTLHICLPSSCHLSTSTAKYRVLDI